MNTSPLPRPRILVALPSYNEATALPQTLTSLIAAGYHDILVVSDGSTDDTQAVLAGFPVATLHHPTNLGQGAAVKSAMLWALENQYDVLVTFDADGQHHPGDIAALVAPVLAGQADVVLGHRVSGDMPWVRRLANAAASKLLAWRHSLPYRDTQSGLRAFRVSALVGVALPAADRFDFQTLVLIALAQTGLRGVEVPVSVSYTPYSQTKAHRYTWTGAFGVLYRALTLGL